jgi:hypothetical protein
MHESDFMKQATQHHGHGFDDSIHLPAPTPWPMVLSLGIALMITGMVTHWVISLLGLVLTLRSMFGWFVEVLPHDQHISVPLQPEAITISSSRATRIVVPIAEEHRKQLPLETFSITAGIKGGIVGGIAMVIPAALYGLLRYHSVWYAVNLLAAGGFVSWAGESNAFMAQFHLLGLLAALGIHSFTTILVGLLYGAMLPMFPKKPIITAGFVAPLLWTGILYSALGVISPVLNARIDWVWFIPSQIAFGLVCGFIVNLQVRVRTAQFQSLPFSIRAGIHSDQSHKKDDAQ